MTKLVASLVAVVLLDLVAVILAFATHRNDPPPLPPFTTVLSSSGLRAGVDGYALRPQTFGFTTTPGRPQVPEDGQVRVFVEGRKRFDPDSSLRYAIAAVVQYSMVGDRRWLDRASTAVREVLARQRHGLIPHEIHKDDKGGKPLPHGWVSAQTQGLLLSALCRLYQATDTELWRSAADEVFDSLLRVRGGTDNDGNEYAPWLSFVDDAGFLWFEELPQGSIPSRSMTGHFFALIGIYDYVAISTGARRTAALKVFNAGAATGRHYVPPLRIEHAAAWTSPDHVNTSWDLHQVLVAQLRTLSDMTGDPALRAYTTTFRNDTAIVGFSTTGLMPMGNVDAYADRSAWRAVPPTGRPNHRDLVGGERTARAPYKPDVAATAALQAMAQYSRTMDTRSLLRATELVDHLVNTTRDGLVPHQFRAQNPDGRNLIVPWYSAQTQGLLLSALVRLAAATGQQRWLDDAGAVFATFQHMRAYPGYSTVEPPGVWTGYIGDEESRTHLWFEKYCRPRGSPYSLSPTLIVDAHITAAIGVYDYWRMTKSPVAARLFDGAMSSLLERLPDIRRNGRASYSALQSNVFRLDHHRVVTHQLRLLAEMTGKEAFRNYSQKFASDAA
jgi:hypothetical protein